MELARDLYNCSRLVSLEPYIARGCDCDKGTRPLWTDRLQESASAGGPGRCFPPAVECLSSAVDGPMRIKGQHHQALLCLQRLATRPRTGGTLARALAGGQGWLLAGGGAGAALPHAVGVRVLAVHVVLHPGLDGAHAYLVGGDTCHSESRRHPGERQLARCARVRGRGSNSRNNLRCG